VGVTSTTSDDIRHEVKFTTPGEKDLYHCELSQSGLQLHLSIELLC